jgi:hypothetical protein
MSLAGSMLVRGLTKMAKGQTVALCWFTQRARWGGRSVQYRTGVWLQSVASL